MKSLDVTSRTGTGLGDERLEPSSVMNSFGRSVVIGFLCGGIDESGAASHRCPPLNRAALTAYQKWGFERLESQRRER